MTSLELYLSCAGGVAVSILIPVLRKTVVESFPLVTTGRNGGAITISIPGVFLKLWPVFRPYAALSALSLLVALLLVAFLQDKLSTWQSAFLAGYVWDATLQKFTGKPT